MIEWTDFNKTNAYDINWEMTTGSRPDLATSLSLVFDAAFDWVNESTQNKYVSIDELHARTDRENASLGVMSRDDGFMLEAERLLAIQQRNSRGFTIIDINPGLLDPIENSLSLPYEFIFDGTNFITDVQGSISAEFRTVNIPIAGNFLKVEFINEINTRANYSGIGAQRPYAKRKYTAFTGNVETNLAAGKADYSYDNYARTKVFVNFNSVSEKPQLVMRSGDSFNTYFNEVNITLSVGAPKIRITVGYNSEKFDGPTYGEFNSKLSMSGIGRILRDSDTVLQQFSINEYDNFINLPVTPLGPTIAVANATTNYSFDVVFNQSQTFVGTGEFLGYSLLWLTGIKFNLSIPFSPSTSFSMGAKVSLIVVNSAGLEARRIHSFNLRAGGTVLNQLVKDEYTTTFIEPLCVVLPSSWRLVMIISVVSNYVDVQTANYSFTIDGYALGEILAIPVLNNPNMTYLITSKYLTDGAMLSYYNRINQISRY